MDPFLGSLLLIPYTFIPRGWAACDGTLLSIQQNSALYSLLGNQFGGDNVHTFALPKMDAPAPHLRWVIATEGVYPSRP